MSRRIAKFSFTAAVMFMVCFMLMAFSTFDSEAASANNATGYVNSYSGVYMRSGTSTSSKKVKWIKNNARVTIKQEVFTSGTKINSSSRWYRVTYSGRNGYIRSDLIDGISYTATAGKVTSSLNYRIGAGSKMKRSGTLSRGTSVVVLLQAKASGSGVTWYKIKIGGGYRYVCASWVDLSSSIFVNTDKTQNSGTSSGSASSSSDPYAGKTFEQALTAQGFPEAYKVKLRALHAAHPKWVFIAKQTGLSFSTAVSKESVNGVSLVEAGWPTAYRDTSSYSYRQGTGRDVYSAASKSSSKTGHVSNNVAFTVLDEKYTANTMSDAYKWLHVRTADGKTGYINGSATSESYTTSVSATAKAGTNIRKGAGTGMTWIATLKSNTKINIILTAKSSTGATWYKFKYGTGYAYISSDYVSVANKTAASSSVSTAQSATSGTASSAASGNTVTGHTLDSLNVRMGPGQLFKKVETYSRGAEVKIIGRVTACDGNAWYKISKNGEAVYALAQYIKVDGTAANTTASVPGTVKEALNYRNTASASGSKAGTFSKGTGVTVTGMIKNGSYTWYRISRSGRTYYAVADYITLSDEKYTESTSATKQTSAVSAQTSGSSTASSVTGFSSLKGTAKVVEGTYIPKDGSTWFNASSSTVAYFMDPRNFLNEDRVYMFEDLAYQPAYQTESLVAKVLSGTSLASNNYQASWFVSAGAKYNVSPVSLAARARQETGGGSIACSGWSSGGSIYYNPFNIGAYSSSNPVMTGMNYAKSMNWNTKQKAVEGSAKIIAGTYISKGQNSLYLQRFNVANGASAVATHQYMTNIMAPYSEALTTKNTYSAYGITNEALTFIIPVYSSMPSSTSLPA